MILAVAGGSDLLHRTQHVFFQKKQSRVTKVIFDAPLYVYRTVLY